MDDTIALIRKSHSGDKAAREQLVKENVGLVHCVVKRFLERGAEREDLFQIGSIGLLKAIDKFDLTYNVKFSTYAVPLISGEIKRFLRDDGMIKVSRSLKEIAYKSVQARERLISSLGREPTIEELSEEVGVEREELVQAMEAGCEIESIYRPVHQKEGSEIRLLDKLEEKEKREDKILDLIVLKELLETLDEEEKQLIFLRYFADRTQSDVGKIMGISQVQVSRSEKRIIEKLRKKGGSGFTEKCSEKESDHMMEDGNGRKKVWICLSIVVLAAVVIGAVYYMNMPKEHSEEGFLIRRESEDCADGIRENALY